MLLAKPDDGDLENYEDALGQSPTLLWAEETTRAVLIASASYPLEDRVYLPTLARAFCAFAGPIMPSSGGDRPPLSALTWAVFEKPDGGLWMHIYELTWTGAYVLPIERSTWPPSALTAEERAGYDAAALARVSALVRFILSASMFIEQTICVERREPVQRAAARQAARAGLDSVVHAIVLRAAEPREAAEGEATDREYSCRWIVRGHWRQQFYPRAARHVPLWIHPHLKGPDGKPLRTRPDVFAVTR